MASTELRFSQYQYCWYFPPKYNGGGKSQSVLRFFPNSVKSPRYPSFSYLSIYQDIYFSYYQSVGCGFESCLCLIFLTRRKIFRCLAGTSFKNNTWQKQLQTRRERPKLEPYLRLKNIQGTTIGNIWKKIIYFSKKSIF